MNTFAVAILLGSIPAVMLLFAWVPGRRAATTSLIGGYLFLPPGAIEGFGFVTITKETCLSTGLLLGMIVCDYARLRTTRFSRWDLFIAVWCLVPIASSLSNDLGLYDGISAAVTAILLYGVPYLVGRAYFRDARDFHEFGTAIVLGGLIYVPFCWFEMRMSPQLNSMIYGFSTQGILEAKRLGGWRPSVFLQHGLAVGMWMASSALVALALWRARRLPDFAGIPAGVWVTLLGISAIGCASTGAIALMFLGGIIVLVAGWSRSLTPLLILAAISPVYLIARVAFDWRPNALVETMAEIDADRAGSLRVRVESDTAFRDHAMARPWFGWGGWGRGTSIAFAADSFFGIALSKHGVVGLVGAFGALIAAQLRPLRRMRRSARATAVASVVTPLIAVLSMYTLDCLLNGMLSPVFTALSGGLIGWSAGQARDRAESRRIPGSKGRIAPRPPDIAGQKGSDSENPIAPSGRQGTWPGGDGSC